MSYTITSLKQAIKTTSNQMDSVMMSIDAVEYAITTCTDSDEKQQHENKLNELHVKFNALNTDKNFYRQELKKKQTPKQQQIYKYGYVA